MNTSYDATPEMMEAPLLTYKDWNYKVWNVPQLEYGYWAYKITFRDLVGVYGHGGPTRKHAIRNAQARIRKRLNGID